MIVDMCPHDETHELKREIDRLRQELDKLQHKNMVMTTYGDVATGNTWTLFDGTWTYVLPTTSH